MSKARVLVTGGSGFIGSGLLKALVHSRGARVSVQARNDEVIVPTPLC